MMRRRSPYRVDGAPHSVAGAARAFELPTDGPRRPPRPGPLCNLCHRQILFVRDDDDWRHLDALAGDDVHAAIPQIQK
jgi:hypothetical protein